ncbi:hypothetical protein IFM89_039065 [Coptis chinensis]|uniref:PsbP C-terminal domain-containing protein n=1 Tax=Coptis chinensis TaxID=261450 RepID=A0A835I8Y1_9MAGN|nr:hypothetical protein IFM89_039065 [Coptis chinensis]
MGATLFTNYGFSMRYDHKSSHFQQSKEISKSKCTCLKALPEKGCSRAKTTQECKVVEEDNVEKLCVVLKRRAAIVSVFSLVTTATLGFPSEGLAVLKQGLLAGRIPGLSEPDKQDKRKNISSMPARATSDKAIIGIEKKSCKIMYVWNPIDVENKLKGYLLKVQTGWRTYRRPDEKSGGHGVGWSPIIPYSFSVPQGWEEVPVSIADLGGTEIDLRFASSQEGRLSVVVAPVLRFADNLGEDVKIQNIGTPDKVISAFGPEVIGENVDGRVLSTEVMEYDGRMYYHYELEPPHYLITATAAGNRLYLFNVTANGLQWKRHSKELKRISETFRVV